MTTVETPTADVGTRVLTVLVGNPRAGSRTRTVADRVAAVVRDHVTTPLGGGAVIEVASAVGVTLTAEPTAATEPIGDVAAAVGAPGVLVVASPAYKGTFTGHLKIILDQLVPGDLDGVVAVPVSVAGSPAHARRTVDHLATILGELGADVVAPVAITEQQLGGIDDLVERWAADTAAALNGHLAAQAPDNREAHEPGER